MRKCCCSILPEPGLRRREARRPLFSRGTSRFFFNVRLRSWLCSKDRVHGQRGAARLFERKEETDAKQAILPGRTWLMPSFPGSYLVKLGRGRPGRTESPSK